MRVSIVLTVIGRDRPGIVESVAATLAAHGANWLDSRMATLSGQFAGMLHASVPRDRIDDLQLALNALEQQGLRVVVCAAASEPLREASTRTARLQLVGHDREGIVRDVSRMLADRGVNVEDLITERSSAPMSGEPLFRASIRLVMPVEIGVEDVRQALEALANDLMVDITLDELAEEPRSE